jgi:hypothetical protein
MRVFAAGMKHRMSVGWREAELVHPTVHNNRMATYRSLSTFSFSFFSNGCVQNTVPIYFHLDLVKYVLRFAQCQ